jgi:hypothetical protein
LVIFIAIIGVLLAPLSGGAQGNPLADIHIPVQEGNPLAVALALKLHSMVVDKIDFDQLDVAGALQVLREKSKELDPEKKGINFVPSSNFDGPRSVTMKLEGVPMDAVLDLIGQQTGVKFLVEGYAVSYHE